MNIYNQDLTARRPLSHVDYLFLGLAHIILLYSALITSDALSGADNIFFRIANVSVFNLRILDFMTFALLGLSVAAGVRFREIPFKTIIVIGACVALSLFSGLLGAKITGYPQVGFIGHELRGLVIWVILIFCFCSLSAKHPWFSYHALCFMSAAYILRSMIETFWLRSPSTRFGFNWVVDSSTLVISAMIAVAWLTLVLYSSRKKLFSLAMFVGFLILVVVGFRRSALVILVGGCGLSVLYGLIVRREIKPLLMACGIGLCGLLFLIVTNRVNVVQEVFSARFAGIFDETARTGSDIEHLADMDDAMSVIKAQPLWGAGMATGIPFRTLDIYGSLTPFHSSYYHTWVRLGLVGFLCYLLLCFWLLKLINTRALPVQPFLRENDIVGRAFALGGVALVILLVKFPPFYLDFKLTPILALCIGVAIAERKRVSSFVMPPVRRVNAGK